MSTASAASLTASDSDGCAWQMRAMSSDEALNSIATTASEISSEATGPTLGTPNTFIFGFKGVGGTPVGGPDLRGYVYVDEDLNGVRGAAEQ